MVFQYIEEIPYTLHVSASGLFTTELTLFLLISTVVIVAVHCHGGVGVLTWMFLCVEQKGALGKVRSWRTLVVSCLFEILRSKKHMDSRTPRKCIQRCHKTLSLMLSDGLEIKTVSLM